MALSALSVYSIIEETLGDTSKLGLSAQRVANMAGRRLCKAHPWRWLVRPPAHLNLRGSITITDGTWTTATLTLTKIGAFTNYVFLEGDEIEITDGTLAVDGWYKIASRTSADAIVLASDIGATTGSTDIDGTMSLWSVALPPDFGELITLVSDQGTIGVEYETTYENVVRLRTSSAGSFSPLYFYAFTYADTAAATGVPVLRLELGGAPTTNDTAGLLLGYRRCWPEISNDNDLVRIPVWFEDLYLRFVYETAHSWTEDPEAATQRLDIIRSSWQWQDALRADGALSLTVGQMSGGAAAAYHGGAWKWHRGDKVVEVT